MPRNVEIKARLRDPEAVRRRAERLSDAPAVFLDQEDTFFRIPEGRFKLRTFPGGRGELIYYRRRDEAGPTTSEYFVHRTQDPGTLCDLLARACGIRAVVRKRRTLYLAGRTRIHLDDVEGLGSFLELEVVLEDAMESEEGAAIADELLDRLGVPAEDRVACAYVDLLEERAA